MNCVMIENSIYVFYDHGVWLLKYIIFPINMGDLVLKVRTIYSFGTLNIQRVMYLLVSNKWKCNLIESRNVVFLKEYFPTKSEVNNSSKLYTFKDP